MIGLGKKQSGAQGAEGFGHLRVGQMLGYELDALVVTVVGRALEQFDMRAVAVGFGKSGNNSERRQTRKRFNIVGGFYSIVHVFAEQRQTNAANQADQERQGDIASF